MAHADHLEVTSTANAHPDRQNSQWRTPTTLK
jgi:hypothetical protein